MTTTNYSQSVNGSLDTAIPSASLNALGSGSYVLGGVIDNRPTLGSTVSFDMADLTITLSSTISAVTPASITVWILPAVDGTNYPSPPGASAGAAPVCLSYTYQQAAGTTQTLICPNLPLPPYQFKVQIQNNLGVAFPSTNTSTCQIMRKSVASF